MFSKLRNKIIIITMTVTTAVLILAGCSIMLFSSVIRPEPKAFPEPMMFENGYGSQDLKEYIKTDRTEGNVRLLITLFGVGATIEIIVFGVSYYLSGKIVKPVKDAYDKQKLFIANASHELKTPLAVIQANMEALDVDEDSEVWKNNIENEIDHANKLVFDLLQIAKMDAGSSERAVAEKIDLAAILKERKELFAPKFAGKIILKMDADKQEFVLPKQDVIQVLDILLDNATKYGDKKIIVDLNANSIVVANDGTMVAKDDLEKIFERFYQADKTKEGSGLGLAIAKAICEQNGWEIFCKSEKGLTKMTVVFSA